MGNKSLHEIMKKYGHAKKASPANSQKAHEKKHHAVQRNYSQQQRLADDIQTENFTRVNTKKDYHAVVLDDKRKKLAISLDDARRLFLHLPAEKRFRILGGKELNNIMDLYQELLAMDDDVFRHHVNPHKNDFAHWINDVLQCPDVAGRLMAITDKETYKEALADSIKDIEARNRKRFSYIRPDYTFIRGLEAAAEESPSYAQNMSKHMKGKEEIEDKENIQKAMYEPDPKTVKLIEDAVNRLIVSGELDINNNNNNTDNNVQKANSEWIYTEMFDIMMAGFNDLKEEIYVLSGKVEELFEHHENVLEKIADKIKLENKKIETDLHDIKKIEKETVMKAKKLFELEKEIEQKENEILHRTDMLERMRNKNS